jgi:hypothetical protein
LFLKVLPTFRRKLRGFFGARDNVSRNLPCNLFVFLSGAFNNHFELSQVVLRITANATKLKFLAPKVANASDAKTSKRIWTSFRR